MKEAPLTPQEIQKISKTYINSNNPQPDNTIEGLEKKQLERFNTKIKHILHWKLQIVLTKCDLIERTELCRRIQVITKSILTTIPSIFHNDLPIVVLSGYEKKGLLDLQNELSLLVKKPDEKLDTKQTIKQQLMFGTNATKLRLANEKEKRILSKKYDKLVALPENPTFVEKKSKYADQKSSSAEKKSSILSEKDAYFNRGIVDTAEAPVDNNDAKFAPIVKFNRYVVFVCVLLIFAHMRVNYLYPD